MASSDLVRYIVEGWLAVLDLQAKQRQDTETSPDLLYPTVYPKNELVTSLKLCMI